jgi:hypothetical protein
MFCYSVFSKKQVLTTENKYLLSVLIIRVFFEIFKANLQ